VLNKIWFALLVIGIAYGFAKGAWQSLYQPAIKPVTAAPTGEAAPNAVTPSPAAEDALPATGLTAMGRSMNSAVFDAAKTAAELALGLIGFMALWLGVLNVAKDAGLVDALARALRPLMRWLFPEVPDGHPAQGAVLMNLSANMLGLDNAATPLGLKAMRELQELNPVKDTATDSMAMFLAINTSSIVLIPFTIISYRALKGSLDPAAPITATLLATLASTLAAILITRWLARWKMFQVREHSDTVSDESALAVGGESG
jgi:spore maturation protein SpmA